MRTLSAHTAAAAPIEWLPSGGSFGEPVVDTRLGSASPNFQRRAKAGRAGQLICNGGRYTRTSSLSDGPGGTALQHPSVCWYSYDFGFFCKGVSHQRPMDTCTSGFRPTASASPSEFHLIKRHVATLDYSRRVFFIRRRQYRIIKRLPSPVPTRATIVWNARLWRALASRAS